MEITPIKINTQWIENLALDEIQMEETGIIKLNDPRSIEVILEESALEMMENLRQLFDIYITRFNELRSEVNSHNLIKTFKISNTVNDFMLFRNSLKLIVSRQSNEVISLTFNNNILNKINRFDEKIDGRSELRAQVGNFNKITWTYHGDTFDIDALVKHFLSEFIQNSSR